MGSKIEGDAGLLCGITPVSERHVSPLEWKENRERGRKGRVCRLMTICLVRNASVSYSFGSGVGETGLQTVAVSSQPYRNSGWGFEARLALGFPSRFFFPFPRSARWAVPEKFMSTVSRFRPGSAQGDQQARSWAPTAHQTMGRRFTEATLLYFPVEHASVVSSRVRHGQASGELRACSLVLV